MEEKEINFTPPPSAEAPIVTPLGIPKAPNIPVVDTLSEPKPIKKKLPLLFWIILSVSLFILIGVTVFLFLWAIRIKKDESVANPQFTFENFSGIPSATPSGPLNVIPGTNSQEKIDCSNQPNTAAYGNLCLPTVKDSKGNVYWAPETGL